MHIFGKNIHHDTPFQIYFRLSGPDVDRYKIKDIQKIPRALLPASQSL